MKKIISFLSRLFNKAKYWINKVVVPSITVVENIKMFVDSPATAVLTAIIPGQVDDKIIDLLKKFLPEVLQVLKIGVECVNETDADKILQCAINAIKQLAPDARDSKYREIAILLVRYLSDKKLSWSEAVHLTEMTYQQLKKQQ